MEALIPRTFAEEPLSWRTSARIASHVWGSVAQSLIPERKSREFQAYCVGLPRSGTHSMAWVFQVGYRARHEADLYSTLYVLSKRAEDQIGDWQLSSFLRFRDKRLQLEFESSHFLYHVVPTLVDLFPASKYVFTVREPISWLESVINFNLQSMEPDPFWAEYGNLVYGTYTHEYENPVLETYGAYPVRTYLSYWREHVRRVISSVPSERLCVVNTFEIDDELPRVCKFLGADYEKLDVSKSRSAEGPDPVISVGQNLSADRVYRAVEEICMDTIRDCVPELVSDMDYLTTAGAGAATAPLNEGLTNGSNRTGSAQQPAGSSTS